MTLAFRYAVRSHVGLVRENNEDSGYAGPHLLMIADGMGGVAGGEVASAITIDVVRKLDRPGHTDPLAALSAAAAEANTRIARRGQAEPRYDGMGTTLTAGVLYNENKLALLHIGDSRAYLLRDGDLTQITHDHTFVQSLVDDGRLTEAQARVHPHRALIIRVLDGSQDHKPDLNTFDLRAGDRLLLCSDGTEDVLPDDIAETLRENPDPGIAAGTLIRLALRSGTSDNVTCVIADVVDARSGEAKDLPSEPLTMGAASEVDLTVDTPAETTADHEPVPPAPGTAMDSTSEHPAVPGETSGQGMRDDEELRYAPRPPRRFRWLTRSVVAVGLVGVLVAAGVWGYDWTQQQYFVGKAKESGSDHVAIYRGIAQDLPGVHLSSVEKVSPVLLAALPNFQRTRVEETIPANDLPHARRILAGLQKVADECAEPTPTPSPKPSPTPTPRPTPGPTSTRTPGLTPAPSASQQAPGEAPTGTGVVAERSSVPSDCAGVQSPGNDPESPGSR